MIIRASILILMLTYANGESSVAKKPNIIFILADDLGWDDVSFHGSPQIPTPNIDALALSGVILNNYYVSPSSFATKCEMMTGKYATRLGVQHGVIHNKQPVALPENEKILPQYMKELGYNTHAIGKWSLGFYKESLLPWNRGFDTFFGGLTSSGADYYTYSAFDENYGLDLRRNEQVVHNETGHYITNIYTTEAVKVINEHNTSNPLFLYVAHQAVHSGNADDPLQAPAEYVKKVTHIRNSKRRLFGGMVTALDESLQNITIALSAKGILDNTVIIFSTTAGGAVGGMELNSGSNFPLRGSKLTVWEGGIRGVAFVYSSEKIQENSRVNEEMFHATDWMPTILGLAGGDWKSMKTLDGFNVWDAISNENYMSPRFEILHQFDPLQKNQCALRVGDYKLIINQDLGFFGDWYPRPAEVGELQDLTKPSTLPNAKVTCDKSYPHPFLEMHAPPCDPMRKPCLFNIQWDPCEFHNLADFMPNTLKVLLDRLHYYRTKIIKPSYPKFDPNADPEFHDGVWGPWINTSKLHDEFNAVAYSPTQNNGNLLTDIANNTVDTKPVVHQKDLVYPQAGVMAVISPSSGANITFPATMFTNGNKTTDSVIPSAATASFAPTPSSLPYSSFASLDNITTVTAVPENYTIPALPTIYSNGTVETTKETSPAESVDVETENGDHAHVTVKSANGSKTQAHEFATMVGDVVEGGKVDNAMTVKGTTAHIDLVQNQPSGTPIETSATLDEVHINKDKNVTATGVSPNGLTFSATTTKVQQHVESMTYDTSPVNAAPGDALGVLKNVTVPSVLIAAATPAIAAAPAIPASPESPAAPAEPVPPIVPAAPALPAPSATNESAAISEPVIAPVIENTTAPAVALAPVNVTIPEAPVVAAVSTENATIPSVPVAPALSIENTTVTETPAAPIAPLINATVPLEPVITAPAPENASVPEVQVIAAVPSNATTPIAPAAPLLPVANITAPSPVENATSPEAVVVPAAPVPVNTSETAPETPAAPIIPIANTTIPSGIENTSISETPAAPIAPVTNVTVPLSPIPAENATIEEVPAAPAAPAIGTVNETVPLIAENISVPVIPVNVSVPSTPIVTPNATVPVVPVTTENVSVPVVPVAPVTTINASVPVAPVTAINASVPVAPVTTENISVSVAPISTINISVPLIPIAPSASLANVTLPEAWRVPETPSVPAAPPAGGENATVQEPQPAASAPAQTATEEATGPQVPPAPPPVPVAPETAPKSAQETPSAAGPAEPLSPLKPAVPLPPAKPAQPAQALLRPTGGEKSGSELGMGAAAGANADHDVAISAGAGTGTFSEAKSDSKLPALQNPHVIAGLTNLAEAGKPGKSGMASEVAIVTGNGLPPASGQKAVAQNFVKEPKYDSPMEPAYDMPTDPFSEFKSRPPQWSKHETAKTGTATSAGSQTESETVVGAGASTGSGSGSKSDKKKGQLKEPAALEEAAAPEKGETAAAKAAPDTKEDAVAKAVPAERPSNDTVISILAPQAKLLNKTVSGVTLAKAANESIGTLGGPAKQPGKLDSFLKPGSKPDLTNSLKAIPLTGDMGKGMELGLQHNDLPNSDIAGHRTFQSVVDLVSDSSTQICPPGVRDCIPHQELEEPSKEPEAPNIGTKAEEMAVKNTSSALPDESKAPTLGSPAESGTQATSNPAPEARNISAVSAAAPETEEESILPGQEKLHKFFGEIKVDNKKMFYVSGTASEEKDVVFPSSSSESLRNDVKKHNIGFNVMMPSNEVKEVAPSPKFKERAKVEGSTKYTHVATEGRVKSKSEIKKVFDMISDPTRTRKMKVPEAESNPKVVSKGNIADDSDLPGDIVDLGTMKPTKAGSLASSSLISSSGSDSSSPIDIKSTEANETDSGVEKKSKAPSTVEAGDLGSIVTLVGKVKVDRLSSKRTKHNNTKELEKKEKAKNVATVNNMKHNGTETNAANIDKLSGPSNSIIVSSVIVVLIASFVVVGMAVVAVVAVVARHCRLGKNMEAT